MNIEFNGNNKRRYAMKNHMIHKLSDRPKIMILRILFFAFLFISPGISLLAQAPPPPPHDAQSGGGGGGPVGGAPLDGGLVILLALGAAYGGKKILGSRKEA
jgi:hypothetical protein